MKKNDYFDTSDSYTYGLDLSGLKLDFSKSPKKTKNLQKRYVCIDLEMTEFSPSMRCCVPGAIGEVIQIGAVMLDENFNMISKFSSFVKPVYSSVTQTIQNLTGITNKNLEGADGFITVFDKFNYWRGEGDITTFCWSKSDHKQLWSELESKGNHRRDLFACLKNFVDLQQIFCRLVSSKVNVSLESALKLLQMEYKGRIHTAYSDSFNTARILHKLFCTDSLEIDFDYINPRTNEDEKFKKTQKEIYSSSFASFLSPELLAQFGYSKESQNSEDDYETFGVEDETEFLKSSPLASFIENEEITGLCEKYKIAFNKWLKLATQVMKTEEMLVA